MDVEGLPRCLEFMAEHSMCQPGAARAPGAVPGRLAGLGHLPQHEVERIALGIHHVDPGAGLQLLQILARELAVVGVGRTMNITSPLSATWPGVPFSSRVWTRAMISPMCWVARGRCPDAPCRGRRNPGACRR